MRFSDLKYLIAFIIPISGFIAIHLQGWWSYITFIIAFILLPIIEQITPTSTDNLGQNAAKLKSTQWIFDLLLFANLPIIFTLIAYLYNTISIQHNSYTELLGMCLSTGIILGSCGINVAHELGHKSSKIHKLAAQALLMPCLYMHFYIEHNRGHHLHVCTPNDPATSRKGESIYLFWIRSITMSYISAWKLEKKRLNKKSYWKKIFNNQMIQFTVIQSLYLAVIYLTLGIKVLFVALCIAVISFLLLETINYIEHYGLIRTKKENGRYERVMPWHSWNSNHILGRIMLYELTRHSDHHYLANKKYQILDHHDSSPQLPLGYPASMLMALCPPIWFAVMNKKLKKIKKEN